MFRPEQMDVKGEIQVTLGNGHVVPARIRMDVTGHVALTFDDPNIVGVWMRLALDNALTGLSLGTLHTKPYEEPRSDGMDFLQEKDGQTVWFHKCRVLGDITLPYDKALCSHCGVIQIVRRNTTEEGGRLKP